MKETNLNPAFPQPYLAPGCKILHVSPSSVMCQSIPPASNEDFDETLFNL